MTSYKGNVFWITGPLCGEFAGHQWIPLIKNINAGRWCFPFMLAGLNKLLNKHLRGQWSEMPWCPYGVTVVTLFVYTSNTRSYFLIQQNISLCSPETYQVQHRMVKFCREYIYPSVSHSNYLSIQGHLSQCSICSDIDIKYIIFPGGLPSTLKWQLLLSSSTCWLGQMIKNCQNHVFWPLQIKIQRLCAWLDPQRNQLPSYLPADLMFLIPASPGNGCWGPYDGWYSWLPDIT